MNESEQDQIVYKVVINQEEQYSIWPADRENAQGWRDVGKQGPKQECLDYINEVGKICDHSVCASKWTGRRTLEPLMVSLSALAQFRVRSRRSECRPAMVCSLRVPVRANGLSALRKEKWRS